MVPFLPSGFRERPARGVPGLDFTVLGQVRVWRDGDELALGSPQQRLTLAVLVLANDRVVSAAELASALWPGRKPSSARGTVRTYVHRLRRVLGESDTLLRSTESGYRLILRRDASDLGRFLSAHEAANRAAAAGEAERAAGLLREALGQWTDDALAGLPGDWAASERRRLLHLGVQTAESIAELELEHELSDPAHLVELLTALTKSDPLRERAHELLMLALCRSGRPAEALTTFEELRVALREGLGVDPGPAVRRLHEQVLRSDAAVMPASHPATPIVARPAQMPPPLELFSGRLAQLDDLGSRLASSPAPNVVLVRGTAGVGKTTFAVHWATRNASSYPDGQLFVNLRGFEAGGVARRPEEVLGELLDALGVPASDQPTGLDALAACYRSALAGRRMLIVLDNASSDAQVLPLLPESPATLALVTSRLELTGVLVSTGAHAVWLDTLDAEESVDLMALRLGRHRIDAEPDAVPEIVARCARLPLALAVVCARIADDPHLRLSDVAQALVPRSGNRLDALSTMDPSADLRSVLSWSYLALRPPAARMFRLLSLMPGAEFSVEAAASLTGLPYRQALASMRELMRACLVTPQHGRYGWHDLLREYSGELLGGTETAEEVRAAHLRLLDHHVVLARAAMSAMDPNDEDEPPPMDVGEGVQGAPAFDAHPARAVLASEYPTLLALIRRAADLGFLSYTWYLAWYLRRFLYWSGRIEDLALCNEIALGAAQQTGDLWGQGCAHRALSAVASFHKDPVTARRHLEQALAAFTTAEDRLAQARVHRQAIGLLLRHDPSAEDYDEAFDHFTRARELMRAEGRPDLECMLLTPGTRILWQAGRIEEAVEAGLFARKENKARGRKTDLIDVLDILAFAHAELGEHQKAIEYKEERIALISDGEALERSGSMSADLAFELVELVSLQLGAGEHARAEAIQREILRSLKQKVVNSPAADDQAADDLRAVLADLDGLISVERPGRQWYTDCETVLRRVGELTDQTGSFRWMTQMAPNGIIATTVGE